MFGATLGDFTSDSCVRAVTRGGVGNGICSVVLCLGLCSLVSVVRFGRSRYAILATFRDRSRRTMTDNNYVTYRLYCGNV